MGKHGQFNPSPPPQCDRPLLLLDPKALAEEEAMGQEGLKSSKEWFCIHV